MFHKKEKIDIFIYDKYRNDYHTMKVSMKDIIEIVIKRYQEEKEITEEIIFIYQSTKELIPMTSTIEEIKLVEVIEVVPRYQSFLFQLNENQSFRKTVDCTLSVSSTMTSIGYDFYYPKQIEIQSTNFDKLHQSFIQYFYERREYILIVPFKTVFKQNEKEIEITKTNVKEEYMRLWILISKNYNSFTWKVYKEFLIYHYIINTTIELPELYSNSEKKHEYLQKNSVEKLQKQYEKQYYQIGYQLKKYIPLDFLHLMTYQIYFELGKSIFERCQFSKQLLMVKFMEIYYSSDGISLKTFLGLNLKDREFIKVYPDKIFICSSSGNGNTNVYQRNKIDLLTNIFVFAI